MIIVSEEDVVPVTVEDNFCEMESDYLEICENGEMVTTLEENEKDIEDDEVFGKAEINEKSDQKSQEKLLEQSKEKLHGQSQEKSQYQSEEKSEGKLEEKTHEISSLESTKINADVTEKSKLRLKMTDESASGRIHSIVVKDNNNNNKSNVRVRNVSSSSTTRIRIKSRSSVQE